MTDREDIDMLAAEYVLGTLEPAQRQSVVARREREPEIDKAITDWEMRLSPLNTHYDAVAPSRDLFASIRSRIETAGQNVSANIASLSEVASLKLSLIHI